MKKLYRRILPIVFLFTVLISGFSYTQTTSSAAGPNKMEVHFIDVGQGDAALITCGGHAMLIDAGDDSRGTAIQNYLQKQNIKKLDYLVLTHPDADHIGGAPVVITKFAIDKVFLSNYEKDNKTYQKLIQALDDKELSYSTPETGEQYTLGTAEITVLAPNDTYDNPNDASIALLVKNGNTTFLFTGDAGEDAENDILNSGIDISADVYKAGHHGSKYSTSRDFFEAVDPAYAVISCAEGNSYGHPHAETLNTFRTNGVKVYRTDEDKETSTAVTEAAPETDQAVNTEITYVLNTKTKKFHKPSCGSLPTANRQDTSESRDSVMAKGYVPCKRCNP